MMHMLKINKSNRRIMKK